MRDLDTHGTGLRHRDFRLFWIGETTSELGTRLANVAVPLLMVADLRASAFEVGLATALEFLPWVLISLVAGALLDRLRLRGVLIACDVAAALLFGWIPVAAWLGLLTIGQVLAVALLTGAVTVFAETGKQAYLPRILGEADLTRGNAVLQTSENAAVLGGPGLGGCLVQLAGAASSLLLNAFSFLASAACLIAIRRHEPGQQPGPRPGAAGGGRRLLGGIRADIREGIRFVARDPYLRPITLWAGALNLGFAGYQALLVPYLVRVLRVSPGAIGLLVACGGAGAILGSLAAGPASKRFGAARLLLATAFLAVPPVLLIALAANGGRLGFLVAGTVVFYFGLGVSNVITFAFRQAYPPPGLRARTTATSWFLLNGVYPPGALLAGALGTWLGIRNGLWIALGIMVIGNLFLLPRPLRRHRDLPQRYQELTNP